MTDNLALFSERFGRRIAGAVNEVEKTSVSSPTENKATILAGHSTPVEITAGWSQNGGTWKCRARRLYNINGTYQSRTGDVEFDLYHPTASEQPTQGIGARVFAFFRGVWELVAGVNAGGGTSYAVTTVPVFYPARQWTHKMPIDGNELKPLWIAASENDFDTFGKWFTNACGLTKEGTQPLPVMGLAGGVVTPKLQGGLPLYYQNVKLAVSQKFTQPDESRTGQLHPTWKLVFENNRNVPLLTRAGLKTTGFVSSYLWLSYIASLVGSATTLTTVDHSAQWETTTDPSLALKMGHQVIAPHNVIGYSLGNECTYNPSEKKTVRFDSLSIPVIVPVLKQEYSNKQIFAEVELNLYEVTKTGQTVTSEGVVTGLQNRKLETIEDVLNVEDECIYAFLPEYQNSKPKVKDTDSIENNCTGKPLLGLWKDGTIPQLLYCENIPYGYCIPLRMISSLVKTTCDDCSPVYNSRKYTVAVGDLDAHRIHIPLNVDYRPSLRCPTD